MSRGIWLNDREFMSFAETGADAPLAQQIATRMAAGEMYWGLLPNPDPVLRKMGASIRVYNDLLVDPMVKGARRRRRAAVIALERGFDPEGRSPVRLQRNIEDIIYALDLNRIIKGLVDGAFFGYGVAEVVWESVGGLIVPADVIVKPPRWFGFDANSDELRFRKLGSAVGEPVPDRKFIVVGNNRTFENPYGEPDLASCFWPVAFRRGGLKFWVTFAEKYGMPWAVGKQRRGAPQAEADELANKLVSMVRDAVAVVPDDSSVELLNTSTTANADMYKELLMYCSREISIALLGNNQTVEMSSNKASAAEGAKVEDELRDEDAEMVAAGLNQLVRWIVDINWPGQQAPQYMFWPKEQIDRTLAERDKLLSDTGVKFSKAYFMRRYTLEQGDIESVSSPTDAPPDKGAPPDGSDFAEAAAVPPDQAAIDAAIELLPAGDIQSAMEQMLRPALAAIHAAATPDEAMAALTEAFPKLDSSALEDLMKRAYFVSDVVGRQSVTKDPESNPAN